MFEHVSPIYKNQPTNRRDRSGYNPHRISFSIIGFKFKFNEINIGRKLWSTIFIFELFIFVRSVSLDERVCVPSEKRDPKSNFVEFQSQPKRNSLLVYP